MQMEREISVNPKSITIMFYRRYTKRIHLSVRLVLYGLLILSVFVLRFGDPFGDNINEIGKESRPLKFESIQPNAILRNAILANKTKQQSNVHILIIALSMDVNVLNEIRDSLKLQKISFDTQGTNGEFQELRYNNTYDMIILLNVESYNSLSSSSQSLIKDYCRRNHIGMIIFHWYASVKSTMKGIIPHSMYKLGAVKNYRINSKSKLWRITRDGGNYSLITDEFTSQWIGFEIGQISNSTYTPLAFAQHPVITAKSHVVAFHDEGSLDGIKKIVFGNTLSFWLHHSMFMDAIYYLTDGKVAQPLRRVFNVDIDDMLLGGVAGKLTDVNIQDLIEIQKRLQKQVEGFQFNLAFSGKVFQVGSESQIRGDKLLIKHKDEFLWFPHTFGHVPPHWIPNEKALQKEMEINKDFQQILNLPLVPNYSVSPRHSGIFPVVEPLYTTWQKIWNITVTSTTMDFTTLTFMRKPRGFIHSGIRVLPRISLEVYSTQRKWLDYPGGKTELDKKLKGGIVYYSLLYNWVNIVMLHSYNFGKDCIGGYALETLVEFVKQWTNLQFVTEQPMKVADKYFKDNPEERDAVWKSPCTKTLIPFYANASRCPSRPFPDVLILGPKKTGTTALYQFLNLHPQIQSNKQIEHTFEEIQFFNNDDIYDRGVDWYVEQFPNRSCAKCILFEKSATYFASDIAPIRAATLLPDAKLIVVLADPIKRAYSYYQHERAHKIYEADRYSFSEVLKSDDKASTDLKLLKKHCLLHGLYARFIGTWLQHFDEKQLHVVDGEKLVKDPVSVMEDVQTFLGVHDRVNYSKILRYDKDKGFFCQVQLSTNITDCLGVSKGRDYPDMTKEENAILSKYYEKPNKKLADYLHLLQKSLPIWLKTR